MTCKVRGRKENARKAATYTGKYERKLGVASTVRRKIRLGLDLFDIFLFSFECQLAW